MNISKINFGKQIKIDLSQYRNIDGRNIAANLFDNLSSREYTKYYYKLCNPQKNNGETARFNELTKSKFQNDLSYEEMCLLSLKQNLYYLYESYKSKDKDRWQLLSVLNIDNDKKLENYINKTIQNNNGRFLTNEEIERYIKIKRNLQEKRNSKTREEIKKSEIDALKYVLLTTDDQELKRKLTHLEAMCMIEEEKSYGFIKDYDDFMYGNHAMISSLESEYKNEYNLVIERIQNNPGFEIILTKTFPSMNSNTIIELKRTIKPDGRIKKERTETCNQNSITWIQGQTNEAEINFEKKENESVVTECFELSCDKEGNIDCLIHTKLNQDHIPIYEVEKYTLEDYQEDIDIINEIKKGQIKGKNLSKIEKYGKNGFCYTQNYENKGYKTRIKGAKRINRQKQLRKSIEYNIYNEIGENIFKNQKTFSQISENETLTVKNGKQIKCKFQKNNIIISCENQTFKMDISQVDTFENKEEIINFLKSIPGDALKYITENNIKISFCDDIDDAMCEIETKTIHTTLDEGILFHELAHIQDFKTIKTPQGKENISTISNDKILQKIYKNELDEFKKEKTEFFIKNSIKYFTDTTGGNEQWDEGLTQNPENKILYSGLSELIAETNMLINAVEPKDLRTSFRSHILTRYFPRTIAYIGNKLNSIY